MKARRHSWAARIVVPVLVLMTLVAGPACAAETDGAPQAKIRSMSEIEAIALEANHDIRLAHRAVDGARAGILQADTTPNPTLSWNGASYSPSNGLGSGGLGSKRVDQIVRVDQTFERGGKRALRIAVAESQLLGKQVDLEEQRRETLQVVRNAYIDLLLAEQRIGVIEETRRSYEASLEAANQRVKAGDLATADLARLRVEVLRARTDDDAAHADRLHAQVALATLLDVDDDPLALQTDGRWPAFVPVSVPAFAPATRPGTSAAVDGRPDYVSAQLAVATAAKSIELAQSQRKRDITFGVQFEHYPGFGGTGNTVGAGVSIPLFFGNDYGGDIAHAVSDREVAEETAAKIRAAAVADAANAFADLDTARRKLAIYEGGLLDAAKSAAASADFAFGRGALGIMDLLDSRRTLLATRLDALAAQADYARAQAAVDAVTTRVSMRVPR